MLIALHGIGPWTADIYLLFCLGHADAWPAGDLAIQEAARIAFDLKARPTTKEMIAIGDAWRPFRGVAAHLLWAYYHVVKRREGAPVPDQAITCPETREGRSSGQNSETWQDIEARQDVGNLRRRRSEKESEAQWPN